MVTASVMGGSLLVSKKMVFTPLSGMLKAMVSAPGVLLAAVIASRRLITPSGPGVAINAEMDEVPPSEMSVVEVTVTVAPAHGVPISARTGTTNSFNLFLMDGSSSCARRAENGSKLETTFATSSSVSRGLALPDRDRRSPGGRGSPLLVPADSEDGTAHGTR